MNVTREPPLGTIKQFEDVMKIQYMKGVIAAQRLGISSYLLSKITGTIYVQQSSDEFREENHAKYNLGLNLKFNKKNEEVSAAQTIEPSPGESLIARIVPGT